ncbi:nucleotidyl transferase AbiEii/AbiGii toxin family protein [Archangium lipolyticum]|uniref:nucleotidyl transferase AbiEii/AbiGii toxin family protein n=1 Tax=Archangium lipolyticum TaxID=2970465 RepID=UPI00214A2141|nr:nucleotidyl transferase AbiEii/AbiGii toxin family protein [Archangium lipolyticum]
MAEVLAQHAVPSAVIGAVALAVHLYPRYTEDFDLAINTNPFPTLRRVEEALLREGFEARFDAPDADDALGGVLRVMGDDFEPIEVVNFQNPWPGARDCTVLAREALREASIPLSPESPLRVVGLPYLIALKLYAGGRKSTNDVIELLERNRDHLELAELRDVCNRHGLGAALEPLLQELGFA